MQNITRIALGLGAAAVVASGGSAFTAASSVAEPGARLGYGSHSVTGVAVDNVEYVSTGLNMVTSIKFSVATASAALSTTDLAQMSLNGAGTTPVDADCAINTGVDGRLITCSTGTGGVTANIIDSVHLVVKPR